VARWIVEHKDAERLSRSLASRASESRDHRDGENSHAAINPDLHRVTVKPRLGSRARRDFRRSCVGPAFREFSSKIRGCKWSKSHGTSRWSLRVTDRWITNRFRRNVTRPQSRLVSFTRQTEAGFVDMEYLRGNSAISGCIITGNFRRCLEHANSPRCFIRASSNSVI